MKEHLHPFLENIEIKSEFGFETAAAKRKRLFELLISIFSKKGLIFS